MSVSRPDDFTLPGGTKTYGEIRVFYGDDFATKAFDLMERMQAGEQAALGELMDLYWDYEAKTEGIAIVVADPLTPKGYSAHPDDPPPTAKWVPE